MNLFYTIARGIAYLPLKLLFPVKVIHKDRLPKKKKHITISNHLSGVDIINVIINLPGYRNFLAKKEFVKNFIVRCLFNWMGVIAIDRNKPDLSAIRKVMKVLKRNGIVSVFPEGTRNRNNLDLQEVKEGVAMFSIKGDAPLVPVMIHNKGKLFKRNYMMVGEAFSLDEFKGQKLNSETFEKAAKVIYDKMKAVQIELNDYVNALKEKKLAKKAKKYKKADSEITETDKTEVNLNSHNADGQAEERI